MGRYEMVSECYVPVGSGFRYKRAGQIVTLSDADAASLAEHVKPVDDAAAAIAVEEPAVVVADEPAVDEPEPDHDKPRRRRVAKRNTPKVVEEPVEVVAEEVEWGGEVISDDGDPSASDE